MRSFGAPSEMGRRLAPYKGFGPGAQNLGAGGIHFRRACKISGDPKDRPGACPWVRKTYGLKAARRAWPALRHTHLRGSADPASGAAALKWPRFFRRRRRFGHFPSSASADLSAGVIKMPPIWAAFCLRSFRAPSQMGRRTAPAGAFRGQPPLAAAPGAEMGQFPGCR